MMLVQDKNNPVPLLQSPIGRGLRISSDRSLCPTHGSRCGSGVYNHESHRRKSRMVEISLSGSGEGRGRVTARPTLQVLFTPRRPRRWRAALNEAALRRRSRGGASLGGPEGTAAGRAAGKGGGGEASNAMLSRRTLVLNTTFLSLTMV